MTQYIRPSDCSQCVVIETTTTHSSTNWTTDLSDEKSCPNNPGKSTNSHEK